MSANRGCKNNPNIFCYINGEFTKYPTEIRLRV